MKTLQVGQPAPKFELPTQTGERLSLDSLLVKGPVVLFFYPVASSGGCTKQACHFRDLASEFEAVSAQRVGISTDGVSAQKGFTDAEGLDYPLLSDADGAVATAYGVRRKYITPVKRATFVIGAEGVVREVITSELNFTVHADKALESLRRS
jgi:peroxiredoxin Q/BCP